MKQSKDTVSHSALETDLILHTERPPQLETPLRHFQCDLTPNHAFFVRWHLAEVPSTIDLRTFRLEVGGHVNKPVSLSMDDLRSKFEPVSLVAVAQCAGNSRSFFEPKIPGAPLGHGAMGNARWTGVRLKDVLDAAGVRPGALQAGFCELDDSVDPEAPRFEKSLAIEHARDGEVMIAYEMNGEPLPMISGFPLRLVVPGWYATYWVKALSSITVLEQPLETLWMDQEYRIPDNPTAVEDPRQLAAATVPVSVMPVHSIFVQPQRGEQLSRGERYELAGVATDGGRGIRSVEVSTDGGKTWGAATLEPDLGKYSWRRWKADWTPTAKGQYRLMVRAVNHGGETQAKEQSWNRGGYHRNVIEHLDIAVI
jgi:DMSO/TMAO reductase YedYZ molybdopterin-dependent catalytic subunit